MTPSHLDPRLRDLDPAFERTIAGLARRFTRYGQARGGRAFHLRATALAGELIVTPAAGLPAHAFFTAGRRIPAIVRHANGAQDDDAAPDNRGASLRLLDEARPHDLAATQLDLLLTTGACFLQRSAREFAAWIAATPGEREAWVRRSPHIGAAAWDMIRRADSFTGLTYHSKVAQHFLATDGSWWFARHRLVPDDGPVELGRLEPDERALPPDLLPRDPGDTRPRDVLHAELRARVAAGAVRYRLQLQLRPDRPDDREHDLDCTRPWHEPWHELGVLVLDRLLPDGAADSLAFNAAHAPPELGLVLARTADESASVNHLRSLVYDVAAAARTGAALPAGLSALLERHPPAAPAARVPTAAPRRICVIGAGASGLTTARALERRGHRVTVLERADDVAGKCDSLAVEGRAFDWGGHFCSDNFRALGRLVAELGVETEPVQPSIPYDLAARRPLDLADRGALGANWLRFIRARDRDFPDLTRPGLATVGRRLAAPAATWLAEQGLSDFARTLAIVYTTSGYGHLTDPELPALYFLKAADATVGAAPGGPLPAAWTIKGGFATLWRRVADELRDLRLGVVVDHVERRPDRVTVHTEDGPLEFDELFVATPLHELPPYLDATAEERAIFAKVRHYDYYTTVLTASGLPVEGFYLLAEHAADPAHVGRTLALHHRYPGDSTYLAYANGRPDQDGADIERMLREDIARLGGHVHAVLAQRRWAYFPHFAAADVAAGIHERLEALQGANRTHFVSSLLNFELVECNVAYAESLVARFHGEAHPRSERPRVASQRPTDAATSAGHLQRIVAAELALPALPSLDTPFADLGLDSLRTMTVLQRIARELGRELTPVIFFDVSTIAELAAHLADDPRTGAA
jgi:acyl carrier protein